MKTLIYIYNWFNYFNRFGFKKPVTIRKFIRGSKEQLEKDLWLEFTPNYTAMDEDGFWYMYSNKPNFVNGYWQCNGGYAEPLGTFKLAPIYNYNRLITI